MTNDSSNKQNADSQPDLEHFEAAISHVDESLQAGNIAVSAAKGILYSLTEVLGTMVGDPDLPSHARSGYEAVLETARDLHARLSK